MIRAVIYCRCSTEEESQVDALQKQVMEAQASVKENGWELTDQYVESKSGTTSKGREQYCRLLEDIRSHKFDLIVIKSQDRLMRNTKDWYFFLDRLLTYGKRLYLYLDRKFYTADDALITGIKAILAEEYSRELSKKIVNAHHHRQQMGGRIMLTNQAYGFRKLPDGNVCVIEEEADIIRQIYRYSAAGYGSRTIANILCGQGVRSKNEKYMTAATIRRMIRNPLYKGIFVMNRQHFDFETKRVIRNPLDQWVYKEGIVPVIVDEELWEKANVAMTGRAGKNRRPGGCALDRCSGKCDVSGGTCGKYIMSGKIICGKCWRPYYRTSRKGCGGQETSIAEWKCSVYLAQGRKACGNVHLNEAVLQELLEQLAWRYYPVVQADRDEVIQKTIRLLEKSLNQMSTERGIEELVRVREGIQEKKKLLLDKLLDGVISDADYGVKNLDLEAKLQTINGKMEGLCRRIDTEKSVVQRLQEMKERLEAGGLKKAAVGLLADDIRSIIVHEWQLEFRFKSERESAIFMDYPFPPGTQKGRQQDRRRILELLAEKPELTANSIAEQLGRTLSMVNNRMRELRGSGCIKFHGSGGHGYWEVLAGGEEILLRENAHNQLL